MDKNTLYVRLSGHPEEWVNATSKYPRMPLAYPFRELKSLKSYNVKFYCNETVFNTFSQHSYFCDILVSADELPHRVNSGDVILDWGNDWLKRYFNTLLLRKRVRYIILTYSVKALGGNNNLKSVAVAALKKVISHDKLVMTTQQEKSLRLTGKSVKKITVGVDCQYYEKKEDHTSLRPKGKYFIMHGDELRLNSDLLQLAIDTNFTIVRVGQYAKSDLAGLRADIDKKRLGGTVIVYEKLKYAELRFLIQNAEAYLGLVNSTWQPAGWTAACDALACGTKLILYEGLVSNELTHLGVPEDLIKCVRYRDLKSVADTMKSLLETDNSFTQDNKNLVRDILDIKGTSKKFTSTISTLLNENTPHST